MRAVVDRLVHAPRFAVWELTLRCNMNCRHCGSNAGQPRPDELALDEALSLCDQLAELGCEKLTLLGGEPFVHPAWEQIARRLKDNGVRCNAISNGWMLTSPGIVERAREAGLTNLALSVDGTAGTHDHLRNRPGSFARVIGAFHLLREVGLPAAAVTVITKQVLAEIEDLYRVLVDEGVLLWQIQIAVPTGRMGDNRQWLIDPSDVLAVVAFVRRVRAEKKIRIDIADNVGYYGPAERELRPAPKGGTIPFWTGCFAGCQNIGIDANGDIKGCLALPSIPRFVEGNIRRTPLADLWHADGAFPYVRGFKVSQLGGFCRTCEYAAICRGGCTAARFGFTGSLRENPYCVHRQLCGLEDPPAYGYGVDELREYLVAKGYRRATARGPRTQRTPRRRASSRRTKRSTAGAE